MKIEPKMNLDHPEWKQDQNKFKKTEQVNKLFKTLKKKGKLPKENEVDKKPKKIEDVNVSLSKRLETSLLNFLEYSTIGGLAELGKRKHLYLRIFWMIVVLTCLSYTLLTIIQKLKLFYNYKVALEFNKFQEIPTKFPAITICNVNPFNEEKAFVYLQDRLNLTFDYGDYNHSYSPYFKNYDFPECEVIQIVFLGNYSSSPDKYRLAISKFKRTLVNNLNETALSTMGYNLDTDMLISCQFDGNSCSESNGDFQKFWNNVYGNCYTFKSDKNFYLTGNQHGFHLEMTVSKYLK